MGEAIKIMRSSVFGFLQGYNYFAVGAALLASPVSASIILSHTIISSASPAAVQIVSSRFRSLLEAGGSPIAAQFISLLDLRISQTISTFVFTLPFNLTFLILAKATVFRTIHDRRTSARSFRCLYRSLVLTQLFNYFLVLCVNAVVLPFLFMVFNFADFFGLSSSMNSIFAISTACMMFYSVIITNTTVVCNLAINVAAVDNCYGYLPVLKACSILRGKVATAVIVALPSNLSMAAVEALFLYRVVKPYHLSQRSILSIAWEGFTITYIHSLLIVLDVVVSCVFFKGCKMSSRLNQGDGYGVQTEIMQEKDRSMQV